MGMFGETARENMKKEILVMINREIENYRIVEAEFTGRENDARAAITALERLKKRIENDLLID